MKQLLWTVVGVGCVLVAILTLLRNHAKAVRVEYWLLLWWFWFRLTLCLLLSVAIVGVLIYMIVTGKGPNGRFVGIDMLFVVPICTLLLWLLVRVGLYGKVSRYSTLKEDRDDQIARFRRHLRR